MSTPRRYDGTRRTEAALDTRRRILAAAREELLTAGYHATTVTSLARRAGVSPQTIYNAVGSKAAVLKAVYDVMLAGDDAPIPMNERTEIARVRAQRSMSATMRAYAAMARMIAERVGPLIGVVLAEGAGGDAELRDFLDTIERERHVGNTGVVTHIAERFGLPNGLTRRRAIDHVWTVTAPEIADRLIRRCGWRPVEYEKWLAAELIAGLRDHQRAR
jgi:AcrR family transcriptional regulator